MNFLPFKNQVLLKREYKQKFFIALGFVVLFLFAINLILIPPSYIFLKARGENLKKQLEFISQSPIFFRFSELNDSLKSLNSAVSFLKEQKEETRIIAPLLKKIVESMPKETTVKVSINFISFERGGPPTGNDSSTAKTDKIIVQGNAETRTALLNFIKNLKQNSNLWEIQSPPSNLLKEKNIDYTLNIFLK